MSETNSSAKVLSLNVVHAVIPDVGGSVGITSIDKRSVSDSRQVTTAGVAGDQRSDIPSHGMPEQAVYAYAREDYEWWEAELDREIPAGKFGENLTTVGIDVTNAVIGQTWRIGTTLLQVTGPRIPCGTFARFMEEDKWVKRFMDEGMPGTYFQILEAGEIAAGDAHDVIERPNPDWSVLRFAGFAAGRSGTVAALAELATLPGLTSRWQIKAAAALSAQRGFD